MCGNALGVPSKTLGPYDGAHRYIVQQLADAGLLESDLVFSHGPSLTSSELDAIKASGAGIVGTPDPELGISMGFPVVFEVQERGCCIYLGIDITFHNGNDLIAQMRLGIQAQRAQ